MSDLHSVYANGSALSSAAQHDRDADDANEAVPLLADACADRDKV